jgi:hypothetical protein
MNYIKHLNSFWKKANGNPMLKSSHLSLYMALFHQWNTLGFKPTFTIHREQIMKAAGIGSKDTYYKCIKELDRTGYLTYHYSPASGTLSSVTIVPLTDDGPGQAKSGSDLPATAGPLSDGECTKSNPGGAPNTVPIHQSINASLNSVPSIQTVVDFFCELGHSAELGKRFWYHYDAIGWRIGNTPIRSWRSLATRWCYNQPKNNSNDVSKYDEPF